MYLVVMRGNYADLSIVAVWFWGCSCGRIAIEKAVCVVAFRNDFESFFPRAFHCARNQLFCNAFSSKGLRHFRMGDDHAVARYAIIDSGQVPCDRDLEAVCGRIASYHKLGWIIEFRAHRRLSRMLSRFKAI